MGPIFLNSNTVHHRVTLQAVLSAQDFLKLQYIRYLRATSSSAQFSLGKPRALFSTEGGLVLVNGVADPHLADEIYGEWAHVFTPNITGAVFATAAIPGAGIRNLPGIQEETWLGAGVLITVKY